MNKVSCFNSYVIVNTFSFSPQPRHLTVAILLGFFYTVYSMVQTVCFTWQSKEISRIIPTGGMNTASEIANAARVSFSSETAKLRA